MAFKPFIRIRLGPEEAPESKHVNLVQDNIAAAISQVVGKDSLDQTLLTGVKLQPSGINYVNHKLGRKLQGWMVVRTQGTGTAINVWDVQDANPAPQLQIYMMASATGTFNLVVF